MQGDLSCINNVEDLAHVLYMRPSEPKFANDILTKRLMTATKFNSPLSIHFSIITLHSPFGVLAIFTAYHGMVSYHYSILLADRDVHAWQCGYKGLHIQVRLATIHSYFRIVSQLQRYGRHFPLVYCLMLRDTCMAFGVFVENKDVSFKVESLGNNCERS